MPCKFVMTALLLCKHLIINF